MESNFVSRTITIYRIMSRFSDAQHPLAVQDIIRLAKEEYDLKIDRMTLLRLLESFESCGIHIIASDKDEFRKRQNFYYLEETILSPAEARLLVDAVDSSKLLPPENSTALVKKVGSLVGPTANAKLTRNLHVTDRAKPENEKVYEIIGRIAEAIDAGRQIEFHYYRYNAAKELVLKNEGMPYTVSPYGTVWDGNFYYLVGWTAAHGITHFRIDRILQLPAILEAAAVTPPKGFDITEYQRPVFRMYADEPTVDMTLICDSSVMNAIIDQFGKSVSAVQLDLHTVRVNVTVAPGPTFYRWVFGFDGKVKIAAPEKLRKKYRKMLRTALKESGPAAGVENT